MAWRPAYQPQVPQTTCGSFADEQFGQRLRAGAASFQLEARRLRDFILLVFFLGTAIAGYLNTRGPSEDSASVVETQVVERRPPGIDHFDGVAAVAGVAIGAALGAQTGAVVAAQRGHREAEQDGLAGQWFEVDAVDVELARLALDRLVLEHLEHVGLEHADHRLEAAPAVALPRRSHRA